MPLRASVAVIVNLLLSAAPALGHHSPSAMYDPDPAKLLSLEGKIVKVAWTNPHSVFHVEVKEPDGKTVVWQVQSSTPNSLFRRGVTRDALPPGTDVTMTVWRARDGSMNALAREIKFPDGKTRVLDIN